jgi:metal-responsive CopG/Arc/MetJ family transcriptional regulator
LRRTTISIPDDLFERIERLARRDKLSRNDIFSAALKEYVARHSPAAVTKAVNRVCDQVRDQSDGFVTVAARRVLKKMKW